MPSSNDSTNPNSPFGVQYGYPQGTRITDSSKVAEILQSDVGMPASGAQLFSSSRASQFSAIGLPRVYPTQRQMDSENPIGAMAQDPTNVSTARHMANPQIANRYFEQRVNQDTKKLETAYRAFGDPQEAFSKIGYEGSVSSMEEARAQIKGQHEEETRGLHNLALRVVEEAGVQPHQTRELTKAQHMAGRIIAGQVERNVTQPMTFQQAHTLASEKLGVEAGQTISAIGGKRLDDYSETEKSAFRSATREVKGGEPKVEQSFSDLTTVVKELSNALKDLTKSAKPQEESKSDLIQKRHDLAMEQQANRQQFTTQRDERTASERDLAHERSTSRQERGGEIRQGHIQLQHKLAMEKQKDAQEHQISMQERREQHSEKMAGGKRKGGLTEFGLGIMHRGDVLRPANFAGRKLARGSFDMMTGIAGGSSIAESLSAISVIGLPIGAMTAMPMSMLQNIGMRGAEMELTALQAEFLETGKLRSGRLMSSHYTVSGIMELSTQLGISPSQSASILKDMGMADPKTPLPIPDITSLAVQGFNPAQVAQLGGQLGMLNAGLGSRDVIGLLNKSGMRGNQAIDFASRIADFTRGRRVAGLGLGKNFLRDTSNRIQTMDVGVEAGLATLGKVQGTVLQAGQGLTSMFGGMVDLAIQASAFEEAGGDLFKAVGIAERISGSPRELLTTLEGQGMSNDLINIALTGKQFTTGQVNQIRRGKRGGDFDTKTAPVDTTESLVVSRKFAQRQQADIKQLYSTTGKDQEPLIDKLDMMLQGDAHYQKKMLENMITKKQMHRLITSVTGVSTSVSRLTVLVDKIALVIDKVVNIL